MQSNPQDGLKLFNFAIVEVEGSAFSGIHDVMISFDIGHVMKQSWKSANLTVLN